MWIERTTLRPGFGSAGNIWTEVEWFRVQWRTDDFDPVGVAGGGEIG